MSDIIVVVDQQPSNIHVNDQNVFITEGPGSSPGFLTCTAGENLTIGDLVYMAAGKVYKFDPSDITLYGKHLGFATSTVVMDAPVKVQQIGRIIKPGWGLTPDATYYALENGLIGTAVTAIEKIVLPVGVALSATELYINFGTFYIIN